MSSSRPFSFILIAFLALALIGSAACAASLSLDSIPVSEDYVLRTWGADDGMPNNNVGSIAQTPDGYIWVATENGLARFDGARFTAFFKDATPGLEANRVATVFAARDGALWAGLERGGVARWTGDRFERILPPAPLTAFAAWTSYFAQDAAGAIWFGIYPDHRVFRWWNGATSVFSNKDGIGPGDYANVYADAHGTVWFATVDGCGVFDGKRFQPVDPEGGKWACLAAARQGGMWAARGGILLHYQADGSREVLANLEGADTSTLYEDRAGDIWIGTKNLGLLRFRKGTLVRVPTSLTAVSSIMEDREGNLWVGTPGGGLNRLRPASFFLRQKKQGLNSEYIVSLCEDSEGKLWLAGWDGLPLRALDAGSKSFATPPGWPGGRIMAMCPDPSGGIWMGTLKGLMHWRDGVFSNETVQDPITALLMDRQGDLWLATIKNGLVRWRNGTVDRIPIQGGLVEPRALAEDAAGRLWVGTESGVVFQRQPDRASSPVAQSQEGQHEKIDGSQFVAVPFPGPKPSGQVRFIVPDEKDTVWIGIVNDGLYRWRAGRIARLPQTVGLPVNDLHVLEIDPGGDFWFGTGGGMFRVARSELNAAIDGHQKSMAVTAYGRNDGMPNFSFIFGFKHTATRTQDGHLWFATAGGALEINTRIASPERGEHERLAERQIIPQAIQQAAAPFPVLIEEVRAAGAAVPMAGKGGFTLPPRPGTLEIHYTLPQFGTPEEIRFRYRLIGLSGEWIMAGTQRTAIFPNLPPGKYDFEVAANERNGSWLPSVSLPFTVRAAWWETGWFQLGAGLAGALAVGVLVRFIVKRRMRARMRRLEQENALERERTRLARDLHDQVGASLTQIALQVEAATSPDSRARLADSVRQTVDDLDGVVWATNPINDTLDSLLQYLVRFSWDFLKPTDLRLRIDFPADVPSRLLPPEFRHHVLLIVREALNNAVKYSEASEIHLGASFSPSVLTIAVADNGRGFDPATCGTDGNGLSNMRERTAALSGECQIDSRPGAGTRITLIVPWLSTGSVLPKSAH